jgi:hypothetical protein
LLHSLERSVQELLKKPEVDEGRSEAVMVKAIKVRRMRRGLQCGNRA